MEHQSNFNIVKYELFEECLKTQFKQQFQMIKNQAIKGWSNANIILNPSSILMDKIQELGYEVINNNKLSFTEKKILKINKLEDLFPEKIIFDLQNNPKEWNEWNNLFLTANDANDLAFKRYNEMIQVIAKKLFELIYLEFLNQVKL